MVEVCVTDRTGIGAGTPVGPKVVGSLGQAGTVAGKEGTAGVRCTSGETRRGAGFDKDTCSAGFFKKGVSGGRQKKTRGHFALTLFLTTRYILSCLPFIQMKYK